MAKGTTATKEKDNIAEEEKNPLEGSNLNKVRADIKKAIDKIGKLRDERGEVQADIQAERERVVALGVPKKALDLVMNYMSMDEDQRRAFDMGYTIAREAIGLPLQSDLFD